MMTEGASESEISAINRSTGGWSPALPMDWGSRFVLAVTLLAGLFMTAAGVAALLAPSWFATTAGFPRHTHFVHDAGAFQLGIGVTLSLAVAWRDGLALALAGFLVANTTHAINHAVDLDLGGHSGDRWGLAALSLLTVVALVVRLGQRGWVIGEVTPRHQPGAGPVRTPEDGPGNHLSPERPAGGHARQPRRRW